MMPLSAFLASRTLLVSIGVWPKCFWIIAVWAIGGFVALSGALTFAELAGRLPQAGGVYAFLKVTYGPLVSFLYGWATLLVITTGAIAGLSIGFSHYLLVIFESLGWYCATVDARDNPS